LLMLVKAPEILYQFPEIGNFISNTTELLA